MGNRLSNLPHVTRRAPWAAQHDIQEPARISAHAWRVPTRITNRRRGSWQRSMGFATMKRDIKGSDPFMSAARKRRCAPASRATGRWVMMHGFGAWPRSCTSAILFARREGRRNFEVDVVSKKTDSVPVFCTPSPFFARSESPRVSFDAKTDSVPVFSLFQVSARNERQFRRLRYG